MTSMVEFNNDVTDAEIDEYCKTWALEDIDYGWEEED